MPDAVYQVMTMLCALVAPLPIGTNRGLLHLLWMLVSGRLLAARGAVLPGLQDCGLSDRAIRRAWAALGQGGWASGPLLARWAAVVEGAGRWQPHAHGGYRPLAVDLTGFWRPRLRGCPTAHYHATAGRALPAIPLARARWRCCAWWLRGSPTRRWPSASSSARTRSRRTCARSTASSTSPPAARPPASPSNTGSA